jgi:hypothetical protein
MTEINTGETVNLPYREESPLEQEKIYMRLAFRNAASKFGLKLDKNRKIMHKKNILKVSTSIESHLSVVHENISTKLSHFKWVKTEDSSKWIPNFQKDDKKDTFFNEQGDSAHVNNLRHVETNTDVSQYSIKVNDSIRSLSNVDKCPSDSIVFSNNSKISVINNSADTGNKRSISSSSDECNLTILSKSVLTLKSANKTTSLSSFELSLNSADFLSITESESSFSDFNIDNRKNQQIKVYKKMEQKSLKK